MRRTGGSSPQGHSGLGRSNAKRAAALGLQPRRHGSHGARTAASTLLHTLLHTLCSVSVLHWARRDATGRHSAGPRRRRVSAQGVACPPSPAPLQPGPATQVAARIWAHSPCGVVQGLWGRWSGGSGWSACVRPLRGAAPGLQLGGSPGPVPGRRTATTLRARGPPRAPRMHLDSCYIAEAGGAVHHGTLPHHGPRNSQTVVFSHRANGGKPP